MSARGARSVGLDQPWWQACTDRAGLVGWPDEDLGAAWCAAARWPEHGEAVTARVNVEAELGVRDPLTMSGYRTARALGQPPPQAMGVALRERETRLAVCLEPLWAAVSGNRGALGMCSERSLWEAMSAAAVCGQRGLVEVARAGLAERGGTGIPDLDRLSPDAVNTAVRAAGVVPFPETFTSPVWREVAAGRAPGVVAPVARDGQRVADQRWWESANHPQGVRGWADEDLGSGWCAAVRWPEDPTAVAARAVIEAELMVRDPVTMADYRGRSATGTPPVTAMRAALVARAGQLYSNAAVLRGHLGLLPDQDIWAAMSAAAGLGGREGTTLVTVAARELRGRVSPGVEMLDRATHTNINRAAAAGGWPHTPALFSAAPWQVVRSGDLAAVTPTPVIDLRHPGRATGGHPPAARHCPATGRGPRR